MAGARRTRVVGNPALEIAAQREEIRKLKLAQATPSSGGPSAKVKQWYDITAWPSSTDAPGGCAPIYAATFTDTVFNAALFDTTGGSMWSAGAPTKLIAPEDGKYIVTGEGALRWWQLKTTGPSAGTGHSQLHPNPTYSIQAYLIRNEDTDNEYIAAHEYGYKVANPVYYVADGTDYYDYPAVFVDLVAEVQMTAGDDVRLVVDQRDQRGVVTTQPLYFANNASPNYPNDIERGPMLAMAKVA